jgi:hypothetical protein
MAAVEHRWLELADATDALAQVIEWELRAVANVQDDETLRHLAASVGFVRHVARTMRHVPQCAWDSFDAGAPSLPLASQISDSFVHDHVRNLGWFALSIIGAAEGALDAGQPCREKMEDSLVYRGLAKYDRARRALQRELARNLPEPE